MNDSFSNEKNIRRMIEQYKESFEKYGDSELSLMWSKSGHNERLESLTNNLNLDNSTILDYGCGLAHLKEFIAKKYNDFCYTGVDIVQEFILYNNSKYNNNQLKFNLINDYNDIEEKYDYIFISGVFNVLIKNNFQEQFNYVKIILEYLFEKTNICLSMNFMSDDVDFINEDSYHQNINELYDFVSKTLSKRLILDRSTMPYEFTMKIFKNTEKEKNIYKYKVSNENC